ncbi:MAG: type II toxin-antitoxin system RelE/ParE family toxin [Chryseobacterium sp.]|nr:type II toxin-antitoxin system RelE/ParE family toxin [Chryseobacterium sp.]
MAIKVYWTYFAKKELKNIYDYYKIKASPKVAEKLATGIVEKTTSLEFRTEIGQNEDLPLDRQENFRYLIFKNYKIIYWFNKDKNRIEISDVFDTRQNPLKIKRPE